MKNTNDREDPRGATSRADGGALSPMEQARLYFRRHHAGVEPDSGFAGRVAAKLERPATDLLGWAAWKLLPATLALALVLAWFAFQAAPAGGSGVSTSPVEDPLAWVLGDGEVTR